MKLSLLLAELARCGVTMSLDCDDLLCRAPEDAMTPDLLAAIKLNKRAIRTMLRQAADMPIRETVRRLDENQEIPLSFNQQRLWFLDQLNPGQCGYVMIRGFRINGVIDSSTVEQTLQRVVSRHRILKTQIRIKNELPIQVVTERPSIQVHTAHIDDVSDEEWALEIERLSARAGRDPFDIAEDPLVRAYLSSRTDRDHVLILTMHHIAADDWSWTIFIDEFTSCFAAIVNGTDPALPELPVSYADYAAHQRASLQSGKVQQQVEYWTDKLRGTLPTLDYPLDNPRPPTQTDSGARAHFTIPLHDSEALRGLAVREGATLFMALLAVFEVLLHRFTNQDDIIVGTPIANRNLVEIAPLIGFFANVLIIRTAVDADKSFLELLRDVRSVCLEAYENQDVPFEHIVEVVNPPRDLNRSPIFDVQFALRNVPRKKLDIPGLAIEEIDIDPKTSKFDLFFFLREEEDQLSLSIEYNADLFLPVTIQRFGKAYTRLVENVVENATRPIAQIPMLADADRQLQLSTWNDTARDISPNMTLHGLVEQQATASPDSIAVKFQERQLTYGELDARAENLAAQLEDTGIGVGDFVGVFVDRSEYMVVALLGVLKTGAAYVPLDPYYPEDRIAFILQDAGITALVVDEAQRKIAEERFEHCVIVNCDGDELTIANARQRPDTTPNLAYIIYTSGSTGMPKGVAVTHRNVVNFLCSMAEAPGIEKDDTLLAVTTLSFDISILEVFLPLSRGAVLCVATRDDTLDAFALAEIINKRGVTIMQATPVTWEMLLATGWPGAAKFKVLCGGELFPRKLADELLPLVPEVWNMYGPTETTIWSSIAKVEHSERPVPIGSPIANTTLYVLDKNLEPLPIGAVGELHIGGTGVAAGYLNREELTDDRFVPDPYSEDTAARLYKTGDLARYRSNGELECLGRIDNQVKIRGFRVELGEIETALVAHDSIMQAAVTAAQSSRQDGFDGLVAHYVPRERNTATQTELRTHLRASLPEYMIPQHYIERDQFPLTPNNKIDRKELALYRPPSRKVDKPAPETEAERYIADVWRDVLNIDNIGRYDYFFEIGGHSLPAAQMVARIENEKGIRIPLREVILTNLSEVAMTHLNLQDEQSLRSGMVKRLIGKLPWLSAGVRK